MRQPLHACLFTESVDISAATGADGTRGVPKHLALGACSSLALLVSGRYSRHISLRRFAMSITTVFTNNRSQAVRLPADARLPEGVETALVRARGVDRIISPVRHTWEEFFLRGQQASEDFMGEREAF